MDVGRRTRGVWLQCPEQSLKVPEFGAIIKQHHHRHSQRDSHNFCRDSNYQRQAQCEGPPYSSRCQGRRHRRRVNRPTLYIYIVEARVEIDLRFGMGLRTQKANFFCFIQEISAKLTSVFLEAWVVELPAWIYTLPEEKSAQHGTKSWCQSGRHQYFEPYAPLEVNQLYCRLESKGRLGSAQLP